MAEDDVLQFGFSVNEKPVVAALNRTAQASEQAGRRARAAGEQAASGFSAMERAIMKGVVAAKALNVVGNLFLSGSSKWQESIEAVRNKFGQWGDDFVEWVRSLDPAAQAYFETVEKARKAAAFAAEEATKPINVMKARLQELKVELEGLRGAEGDVILGMSQYLHVGGDDRTKGAAQQSLAKQKQEIYDQIAILNATIEAWERGGSVTGESVQAIMNRIPQLLDEDTKKAQERLEIEEKIKEARLEFVQQEHERLEALRKLLEEQERRESWAGFSDGITQAIAEMKDMEAKGREVAASLRSMFDEQLFQFFKTGIFDAKKALSSLLDIGLRLISNLASSNLTVGLAGLFGFRALGGPVTAGSSYIVGEKGPEVFTPATSGTITPTGATPPGGTNNVSIPITVNMQGGGTSDPRMMAEHLGTVIEQRILHALDHNARVREAFAGGRR